MALINIDIHATHNDTGEKTVRFTGHHVAGIPDFGIIVAEQNDVRVSLYLSKELVMKLGLAIQDWLAGGEREPPREE